MADSYSLPRHAAESARLNDQHHVLKTISGFPGLLHPCILASLQTARIADMGTGTGAWLLELSSQRTQDSYTGLDISAAQFPSEPPSNITFDVWNVLDPAPPQYQGCFKVVHVRLVGLALVGEQFSVAARNLMTMTKSGGWIQWGEADAGDITHRGLVSQALKALYSRGLKVLHTQGRMLDEPRRLKEVLEQVGFEEIEEKVVSVDEVEAVRQGFNKMFVGAFSGILSEAGTEGEDGDLVGDAEKAVLQGSWSNCKFHVVVGQKA
ncbi:hypothetical protein B0A48_00360 [Cryoendolithus antarcticus]|uniref:Methyltransferase domain-containing protein n=1 Tax=Cryoendolithus antarcticus TaxID=1507870 RepID=A0A1V8TUF0_9PEZI|nr:hypothetical protein B0A48_00360 [Cryoendolithus antarcticus]